MRKFWMVAVIVIALLVAGYLWWRKRPMNRASSPSPATSTAAPRRHIDPDPAITVRINHSGELTLYRGTPMVITVRVLNYAAMIADAQEESDQIYIRDLQAASNRGELTKEIVDARINRMEGTPEVGAIHLGDDATPWSSFLQLAQRMPDGTERTLSWTTKAVQRDAENKAILDARTQRELTFVVDPATAQEISSGQYDVVASLKIPVGSVHEAGAWTGQSSSDPVNLTIQEKPARLAAADQEKLDLYFSNYSLISGDYAEAAKRAQAALAVNPHSIFADVALAEAKKSQGDPNGALEVFQVALSEYYRQFPKSYEPPTLLLSRIAVLEQDLEKTGVASTER